MKRLIGIITVALFAIGSYAQSVRFGIKGGLNVSKETDNAVYSKFGVESTSSFRPGVHIGGVMNVTINRSLDIETDIMYSMQGVNDFVYAGVSGTDKLRFHFTSHYITLPVALKFYPVDKIYLELGPQLGFLLSKTLGMSVEDDALNSTYGAWKNNTFDIGLLGGIGYAVTDNVFVEVKYVHGFCDTFKSVDGYRNRNIQVSVGYLF